MLKPLTHNARNSNLNTVRGHLAEHLIGNTVDLLTGSKTILHGIVTGALTEAGKPKIVVNGRQFDLQQVLTVQPATLI
jgi:hypothetical protein